MQTNTKERINSTPVTYGCQVCSGKFQLHRVTLVNVFVHFPNHFFRICIQKLGLSFKVILLVVINVLEYFAKVNFDFNEYFLNAETSSKEFFEIKMV